MQKSTELSPLVSRRNFFRMVAVAGGAAACWQLGLFGTNKALAVSRRSLPIMGTVMNITLYGPDQEQNEAALNHTIQSMNSLAARLSRHVQESPLSELNRTGQLINADKDLHKLLSQSIDLSKKSDGAFDVTVLPALRVLEAARESGREIGAEDMNELHRATQLIDYRNISLDNGSSDTNTVRLEKQGMGISLDGIAKGYIVDRGIVSLKEMGFGNVCLEAGGDLMVTGNKAGREPWHIGIRNPRPEFAEKPVIIPVSNRAVATSGDYMQSFTADRSLHHIIDPKRGDSPDELASCTVVAPTVTEADSLATAVMVLGREHGLELIEAIDGCEAYLVTKDRSHFNTSGFFS